MQWNRTKTSRHKMKITRAKQILEAAAKLPPAKARALISAVRAKSKPTAAEDFITAAMAEFEKVMLPAMLDALTQPEPETTES